MEIKKPEVSEKDKARVNELYKYMKGKGTCTKQELCAVMGWEYNNSNDRRIRELLSILAKRKPLISTSDTKGYRLALTKNDYEDVKHQWLELDSRIKELEERRKPLIEFLERFDYWGNEK